MKQFTAILITCICLTSCTAEKRAENRLRRAERKIEKLTLKFPQLLEKDTIRDTIAVRVPEVHTDTAFSIHVDSVVHTEDRLVIRYIRVGDTIRLSGTCKDSIIYVPHEVITERVVVRKQSFAEHVKAFARAWWWVILLAALILFIIKVGWKFIKPF